MSHSCLCSLVLLLSLFLRFSVPVESSLYPPSTVPSLLSNPSLDRDHFHLDPFSSLPGPATTISYALDVLESTRLF